jgi:hypothetical protein
LSIRKTNPTIADDLLKGGGVEDFNELSNRPLQVPASDDLSVTCAQETVLLCNCNCVTLPINRKSDATVGLVVMIV